MARQKFGDSVEKSVERVVNRVTSLGGASGDDGGDKPKAAADDVG